jgi:hypothetical protein
LFPELPEKAKRESKQYRHDGQKDNSSDIGQHRGTTGHAGGDTSDHSGGYEKDEIEKDIKDEEAWAVQNQVPYLQKSVGGSASLTIHNRNDQFQYQAHNRGRETENHCDEN